MSDIQPTAGSMQLVEELFRGEDERFVEELRRVGDPKALAAFVERWKVDGRPWARQQQTKYIRLPLDRPGHEPVVKRLFKQADRSGDDELMPEFLAAFDRLVRRRRRKRWRYDWQSRTSWEELALVTPSNQIPRNNPRVVKNPFTGASMVIQLPNPRGGRLFSYATRGYLRRRAARYFRKVGFFRPASYVAAVCRALALYADDDLAQGEDVLECWGLLDIAFRHSPSLQFTPERIRVREGSSLGQLSPAPRFAPLWQAAEAGGELIRLLTAAQANLVRQWTVEMLRRNHAALLARMDIESIGRLLTHSAEHVRHFGAGLLMESTVLGHATIGQWLKLLETPDPTVLASVCAAIERHVKPERLTLAECVAVAGASSTVVSRLGLRFLQPRKVTSAADRQTIAPLAHATCEATAAAVAAWALRWFSAAETYDRELVTPFFDSACKGIRRGAWRWLLEASPAYGDPVIWARLTETPYDDIRAGLVAALEKRAGLPGVSSDDLAPVWASVLLGVQRGGRQKPKAAAQIAAAIAARPERADSLLPVLAVALRSVRPAEMRSALAALATLVSRRPESLEVIMRHLPELEFDVAEAPA